MSSQTFSDDELAELNGQGQQHFSDDELNELNNHPAQSWTDRFATSPLVNGVLGMGDSLRNFGTDVASLTPGVNIAPYHSSSGTAYNVGQAIGDAGSFIGGGEAADAARLAAKGIPYAGRVAGAMDSGIGALAKRIGGASAYGATTNPQDREAGAITGAEGGAAGEALPLALKGLDKAAEFVNPLKYTSKIADVIKQGYQAAKDKASSFYNPVLNQYGNKNVYYLNGAMTTAGQAGSQNYRDLGQDTINTYFTPKLKKLNSDFMDNPSVTNAHRLQSELGNAASQLKTPDLYTATARQTYGIARDALNNDLTTKLGNLDPDALASYQQGRQVTRDEVSPYRATPTLQKVANGTKPSISPVKLANAMQAGVEKGAIPAEHPLQQHLAALQSRIHLGNAVGTLAGVSGGAALGGPIGSLLAKSISPQIASFVQNPAVRNIVEHTKPLYDAVKRGLIGYNTPNQ